MLIPKVVSEVFLMNDLKLHLCETIYNAEMEQLSKEYIKLVDSIIPCEGELDGNINTLYNQALLYQLKDIAKKIPQMHDVFEIFRKRIYFLEVHGVKTPEAHPAIEDATQEFLSAYSCYAKCIALALCCDAPIFEIKISEEVLEKIEDPSFFECDTLIGALRAPRQFGVCLKRKFYHIPAKYIEEYAIPKYVAIYQSERLFGKELAGVKYYGEVKKCVPLKRNRIRELPSTSNELYYKFKVKKWQRLENPISAKEIGFVRLFTSFSLLQNSSEIPELTLLDKNDFLLYHLIKQANDELKNDFEKAFVGFEFLNFQIFVSADNIYLCKDENVLEKYKTSSFFYTPSLFLEKIMGCMKKHSS